MNMKKLVFLLIAVVMLLPAGCSKHSGKSKKADISKQLVDPAFRAYCLARFDIDDDGRISSAEAKEVTEIIVPNLGISTLKGIEAFKNLERLDCSGNRMKCVDLSKNLKLTYLNCLETWMDVIYLADGQTIDEIQRDEFLYPAPLTLTMTYRGDEYYTWVSEMSKPLHFEATFTGDNVPDSVTWVCNVRSFVPFKTAVQGSKATLDYDRIYDLGDMDSETLYRMYAVAPDGTRSNYVRFGMLGKHPLIYFEKPDQHLESLRDQRILFSVFFYPGEGESGTPSIKTYGEGCNRSFNSGVKIGEDESVHWDRLGEKRIVVYFEKNGVHAQDTLYVNIVQGLPKIEYR